MAIILTGALALNLTLTDVAHTRMTQPTAWAVTQSPEAYPCLLAVPYGYGHLIDQELVFITEDGGQYGPMLVVDVEAPDDAPHMHDNHLAADTDCEWLVHRWGSLVQFGSYVPDPGPH